MEDSTFFLMYALCSILYTFIYTPSLIHKTRTNNSILTKVCSLIRNLKINQKKWIFIIVKTDNMKQGIDFNCNRDQAWFTVWITLPVSCKLEHWFAQFREFVTCVFLLCWFVSRNKLFLWCERQIDILNQSNFNETNYKIRPVFF